MLQEEENGNVLYHFIFCEDRLLFPLFLFTYLCIDLLFAFCTMVVMLIYLLACNHIHKVCFDVGCFISVLCYL
jgi:hypothetical protein